MPEPNELVVASDLQELPRVINHVRQACVDAGLSDDTVFACELATDEACTNIIEHAYQGRDNGEIRVSCVCLADRFVIRFHDWGQPFVPEEVEAPRLTLELSERSTGGLGLHFMRSMMDEVHFEFDPQQGNVLTMVIYVVGSCRDQDKA